MGGSVVEVEPVFFYVLAVVALVAGKAEHALFEDGVAAIPQGQREDQKLVAIADSRDAVFTPAIGLAARHVVGEKFPGAAIGAVVLAHAAPGTFADVGPPLAPGRDHPVMGLEQALMFLAQRLIPTFGSHRRLSSGRPRTLNSGNGAATNLFAGFHLVALPTLPAAMVRSSSPYSIRSPTRSMLMSAGG